MQLDRERNIMNVLLTKICHLLPMREETCDVEPAVFQYPFLHINVFTKRLNLVKTFKAN